MRAARAYVPVIIRRPHAYDFLMQAFEDQSDGTAEVRGAESGLEIGELELPIPGFYVLDAQGKIRARTGLGSVDDVLAVLHANARP